MPGVSLKLVEPALNFREDYMSYLAELHGCDESPVPWVLKRPTEDFPALVRWFKEQSEGKNLKEGFVAHSTFWMIDGGRKIVGVSNLRHGLTDGLRIEGGHIGYGIRPSQRRKGFGTRLLALTLEKASQIGISRVMVTCDAENSASVKIIIANGGRMDSESILPESGKLHQRYIIKL